MTDVVYF
jgi:hypothetical protein